MSEKIKKGLALKNVTTESDIKESDFFIFYILQFNQPSVIVHKIPLMKEQLIL